MSKKLTKVIIALALLLTAVFICSKYIPKKDSAPVIAPKVLQDLNQARKACASANIVVCCIDAARRDHIGCYGYDRPTTPSIDQLAREGVRFENAVSDATYTIGAIASLWTSQSVDTHGVSVIGLRVPPNVVTLPEACKNTGLRTAVFSTNGIVCRRHGFADGVDNFNLIPFDETQQVVFDKIQQNYRSWLNAAGKNRFFMYVHVLPPHHPYEYAGPFRGRFSKGYKSKLGPTNHSLFELDKKALQASEQDRKHIIALYDEALMYADSIVGTLVNDLQKRGLQENTIFVLMADHGEAFSEHGRWLHSNTVFNELTHIPLIIRFPKGVKLSEKTVPGLVQLSDIAPTLASLAGLRAPENNFEGKDQSSVIFGGSGVRHAAFSRCLPEPALLRSVEIPGGKGMFDDRGNLVSLFNLADDPGEKSDIKQSDTALAQQITAIWQEWAKHQTHMDAAAIERAPKQKLDDEVMKQLRSLGYLK